MPGQIPNRTENLSRPRDANRSDRPEVKRGELLPVTRPEPDPEWHKIATMIYDSLATSGQACYMQDSDWAYAWSLCEEIDNYKRGRRGAQMFASIMAGLNSLMMTEGERRRARIELSEPEEKSDASVTAIASYRKGLETA